MLAIGSGWFHGRPLTRTNHTPNTHLAVAVAQHIAHACPWSEAAAVAAPVGRPPDGRRPLTRSPRRQAAPAAHGVRPSARARGNRAARPKLLRTSCPAGQAVDLLLALAAPALTQVVAEYRAGRARERALGALRAGSQGTLAWGLAHVERRAPEPPAVSGRASERAEAAGYHLRRVERVPGVSPRKGIAGSRHLEAVELARCLEDCASVAGVEDQRHDAGGRRQVLKAQTAL